MLHLIAFSLTINWHQCLTLKGLLSLKPYHFIYFTLNHIHDIHNHFCIWSSHITSHMTIFQFNLICKVELIEYFFKISLKPQLFRTPNIRSVIRWPIIWIFPFMLSILSNQPSCIVSIRLTAFYNSKSSKSNKSAKPFRQKIRKLLFTLRVFIKGFYLGQWLNLLLATFFLKIFLLVAKISLLALPLLKTIILLLCHVLSFPLLMSLYRLFLLYLLWLNTWKITFSKFSKLFWILDLLLLFWLLHQLLNDTKTLVKDC